MIIVRLKGGLGNQLFQYAFARSISHNLNTELFLDISSFSHKEHRKHVVYGLNAYNIKAIVGSYPFTEETSLAMGYNQEHTITKYNEGIKYYFPDTFFDYKIIKDISDLNKPAYFDGYFQQQIKNDENNILTENFFKINNKIIHEDLKYNLPVHNKYSKTIKEMKKYDSIALHIRHGDYEDLPEFGLCSKQYYQNAIEEITKKVDNPKFFIFTEDHQWAKDNLKIDYPVEHVIFNERKEVSSRGYAELLKVMSLCDHFIIANSTFSWWAAFLGENPDKIIITPKPWFQDRSCIEVDTIDNKKTINLTNNYLNLYKNSKKVLYKLTNENIEFLNMNVQSYKGTFHITDLSNDSKIFLKNIKLKQYDNKAIINLNLETNSVNALKIYYKTIDEDYNENNTRTLYYYKNDSINHYLILPKEALLDELMIKPYTIQEDSNVNPKITLKNIEIKEISLTKKQNKTELINENHNLKKQLLNQSSNNIKLNNENKQLKVVNDGLEYENKELKSENEKLIEENQLISKQKDELIEKNNQIISDKDKEITDITSKNKQELITLKEENNKINELLKQKDELIHKNKEESMIQIQEINSENQNLRDIIEQQETKNNILNENLIELKQESINKDNSIQKLTGKIEKYENIIKQKNKILQENEKKLKQLNQTLNNKNDEIVYYKEKIIDKLTKNE